MKKIFVLPVLLFFITACFETDKNPVSELSPLYIGSGKNQIAFNVETALSNDEMATGLMYRKSMPEENGMIFVFPSPRNTAFWMKNTYIPLDMIFIDENNKISGIVENVPPLSEDLVYSPAKTKAVLELNAGTAKAKNLRKGLIVRHSKLNNL